MSSCHLVEVNGGKTVHSINGRSWNKLFLQFLINLTLNWESQSPFNGRTLNWVAVWFYPSNSYRTGCSPCKILSYTDSSISPTLSKCWVVSRQHGRHFIIHKVAKRPPLWTNDERALNICRSSSEFVNRLQGTLEIIIIHNYPQQFHFYLIHLIIWTLNISLSLDIHERSCWDSNLGSCVRCELMEDSF